MALVPGKTVLDAAHRGNWAVGAFNANNLEYVQGIIDGATSERAPVIIQASPGAIRYMGMDYITAVVRVAGDTAPIPVVLHLDHSKDLDELARCVERGFTSVMFDGSALDFEENVKLTKEAVDIAHKRGVSCEGELGRVPSSDRAWTHEELEEMMTSPDEAEEFVKRTGVDSLAVSVGSVHKMREKTAEVNAKRIGDLRRRVNVPLVLHGSSGVSDASLAQAVLFRFGKLAGELAPGLNVILPFGIDKVNLIDMRTFTIDVPRQEVITRDNVPVNIDAVVYFRIFSAAASVTQVQNYREATSLLAQTILRSVLGQHELDDMLAKRAELNETLRELLDEATDPWGVKVTAVEMKSLELPEEMKRAMAKQAEAERERRAKIIAAEGEWQAAKRLAEAAEELGGDPAALQLRYLQTLSEVAVERNSTIIFPLPMEILRAFSGILPGAGKSTPQQP